MAQVLMQLSFDAEETNISAILDAVYSAVEDVTGEAPMIGLEVDGEHRDPDDPTSDLFS